MWITPSSNEFPSTGLFRSAAPREMSLVEARASLVPDLDVLAPWHSVCDSWSLRLGALPHLVRVIQLSSSEVALVELRTDSEGFGDVRMLGVAHTESWQKTATLLAGRSGVVVFDARLSGVDDDEGSLVVSDESLRALSLRAGVAPSLRPLCVIREELASDLMASTFMRRRSALTVVRDELISAAVLRSRY